MKDRLQPPPHLGTNQNLLSREDLADPQPSPPYRSFASTSQVVLESSPQESPAYRSQVDLMADYNATMKGKSAELEEDVPRPTEQDVKPQPKPTVHYPDNVHSGPAPIYQTTSPPIMDSRVPSLAGTDDDEEEEDYDWSGDDDLDDEEAKFEEKMGIKRKPKGWSLKRIFTLLFSSLIGSTFLSALLVAPGILIHFFWYENSPTAHRRFVKDNVQAWLFWAAANVLISWYLAMIIDVIPVIIKLLISATWGHVSEYVKNRIELYDSVKDTVKPLLYAATMWASWVILFDNIYGLYNSNNPAESWAGYTSRVAEVVEFLFFLVLVVCAQKMLSHAIAFAFHRAAYRERVDELRESLRVIEALRDYRPKPTRHSYFGHHSQKPSGTRTPVLSALGFGGGGHDFNEKEHYNYINGALRDEAPHSSDDGVDGDVEDAGKKRKGKQKKRVRAPPSRQDSATTTSTTVKLPNSEPSSRPLTPSGLNPNVHRYPPSSSPTPTERKKDDEEKETEEGEATLMQAAKVLKSAVLHDARNVRGKDADVRGLVWNVNSTHEAKRLARAIYMRFKDRHRIYLVPGDFHPAFPTSADADAAFRVFDTDNNGDISRAEIKSTLLRVYKERRFLSRSMRDVGVALKTLDRILLFFAFVILFFISLSVFGVAVGNSLTSVYTVGIAASFIFKNAASNAFDAVTFLFVTHPFDTGDRIFINDENLVVKKMGLFATVFTRSDGTETYYFNSQLFVQFITNVRRSGKQFENCTIQVAWRTPLEKLDALEKCLNDWLATEENRWFEPSTSIMLQNISYQRYMELTIGIGHNGTWQDWGLRNQRKTAFHAAVNFFCRQLGIVAYKSPIPIAYADNETQSYMPSTPMSDRFDEGYLPPPSPSGRSIAEEQRGEQDQEQEASKENMKPVLGFLPPLEQRTALTRARRSKNRKGALRSTGADGF